MTAGAAAARHFRRGAKPLPLPTPALLGGYRVQFRYAAAAAAVAASAAAVAAALAASLGATAAPSPQPSPFTVPSALRVWLDELREAVAALSSGVAPGDLDASDFAAALPSAPPGSPGTVVIALEGTVVARDFDRLAGTRVTVRPGLRQLLVFLGDAGFDTVLWSPHADASLAGAYLDRLVDDLTRPGGLSHARWVSFCATLDREARGAAALELQRLQQLGAAEGAGEREQRSAPPLRTCMSDGERKTLFTEGVLRIVAVLGRQHGVASSGDTSSPRILPLPLLPRPDGSILLVDSNAASAAVYPDYTILVPPFVPHPGDSAVADNDSADTSLLAVRALLERYVQTRTEAQAVTVAARVEGEGGDEQPLGDNVGAFLRRMREWVGVGAMKRSPSE